MFARGGFDLQVGNPPWVRPRWSTTIASRRARPLVRRHELRSPSRSASAGATPCSLTPARSAVPCGAGGERGTRARARRCRTREPLLAGQQTNLYLLFITGTWRRLQGRRERSACCTPTATSATRRRRTFAPAAYRRLREALPLHQRAVALRGDQPYSTTTASTSTAATAATCSFTQAAFLYHPRVVDRSIGHDGTGDLPGHANSRPANGIFARIASVSYTSTTTCLTAWAALFAYQEPASSAGCQVRHVGGSGSARRDRSVPAATRRIGTTTGRPAFTSRPHLGEARSSGGPDVPLAPGRRHSSGSAFRYRHALCEAAARDCRQQQDYDDWDLDRHCRSRSIPRTNWQRAAAERPISTARDPPVGWPAALRAYRMIASRQMVPANTYRSVFSGAAARGHIDIQRSLVRVALERPSNRRVAAGLLSPPLRLFRARHRTCKSSRQRLRRFPVPPDDHPTCRADASPDAASELSHRGRTPACGSRSSTPIWRTTSSPLTDAGLASIGVAPSAVGRSRRPRARRARSLAAAVRTRRARRADARRRPLRA